MKTCSRCKEFKDLKDFANKKSSRDGLHGWCRRCCADHKQSNRAAVADGKKEWAAKNRDKLRSASARWFQKNKHKRCAYQSRRYRDDVQRRMACVLRSRLSHAVKRSIKSGSAVRDLGCSMDEFIKYIESKFLDGMSWSNYGHKTWHIDHVVPLSSFDLADPDQLKKACHYTNLQPMWAADNLSKGSKLLQTAVHD